MKRRISPTAVQSLILVLGCGAAGLCLSTVSGEALPGALQTTTLGTTIGLIAVAVGLVVRRPARALERILATAARSKAGRSILALRVKERGPGYVELMRIGAIPVFVHRSLPLGGLLISAFGGFDLKRALYFSIGYFLLVGVHEAGHAAAARSCALKVFAVELSGVGGLCRSELALNARHCALVYSGGLLAQALLLGLALCWMFAFGPPKSEFGTCLLSTTTIANLILLLFNLVPFEERSGLRTDGLALWQLYLYAFRGAPHPDLLPFLLPRDKAPVFRPEISMVSTPALVPEGFSQGIEVLNDRTTPMKLVLRLLMQHLQLSKDEAIAKMIAIHNRGGVLISLPNLDAAVRIAAAIAADARGVGHRLACRAVVF